VRPRVLVQAVRQALAEQALQSTSPHVVAAVVVAQTTLATQPLRLAQLVAQALAQALVRAVLRVLPLAAMQQARPAQVVAAASLVPLRHKIPRAVTPLALRPSMLRTDRAAAEVEAAATPSTPTAQRRRAAMVQTTAEVVAALATPEQVLQQARKAQVVAVLSSSRTRPRRTTASRLRLLAPGRLPLVRHRSIRSGR